MRKIYQKYFALPEEGKGIMGEQVFFARLAVSIVCIVLCMSAMGFFCVCLFYGKCEFKYESDTGGELLAQRTITD